MGCDSPKVSMKPFQIMLKYTQNIIPTLSSVRSLLPRSNSSKDLLSHTPYPAALPQW